jgi:hypothetical protein
MSLDLTKVAAQVAGMVTGLKDAQSERQNRLQFALKTLGDPGIDLDALKQKIAVSIGKTTWLVADLVEEINRHYPAASIPADFIVMAADGSHIDVDRHRSARCFLINTGSALINYGSQPAAALASFPYLYSSDEELVINPPAGKGREQVVEGALLGIKRAVEECRLLFRLAAKTPAGSRNLALLDGSLILWGLEGYPDFVSEVLLKNGLLQCLDEMKQLNADRSLALASYISYPRSTDVVNVLRVAICPHQPPDCDVFCPPEKERDCAILSGLVDRELFASLLQPGERSALFISPSKVVREHYGPHRVYFFYLKSDEEIARVEVPEWVALDAELLNLAHSLILDQCRRGQGYPVALSEAHEQAVVTGADRENFWELVESCLVADHISSTGSAKSFSKRTRWV